MSHENTPALGSLAFADALGESFQPATDPAQNRHTMARLARAAREKGLEDSSQADILGAWKYEPSWGGGAIATAYYFRPMYLGFDVLAGIAVESNDSSLRIGNSSVRPIPGLNDTADMNLRAETNQSVFEHGYGLSLGSQIDTARLVVAQYAQDFFDQLA